jgi:hypothetical protein
MSPQPLRAFWPGLERMPGLNAIRAGWSSVMGPAFDLAKGRYFRKQAELARSYFCERCNCAHEVVTHSPEVAAPATATAINPAGSTPAPGSPAAERIVAVCRCDSPDCADIPLTPAEIEIWELHWSRLGRSLCDALDLMPQEDEFPFYNTLQIGSWPESAVPVFLTIQSEPADLRAAINELGVRHQDPFILLVPTAAHLKFACRELLTHRKADFLPLETNVLLTDDGGFRAARPPGELLARFNPQPDKDAQQIAISAVALVHCLEGIKTNTPPTVLQVFERRYLDQHSKARIAKDFDCSPGTVRNRLRAIKRTLGDKYRGMERYVPLFREAIEQRSNPKARRIYMKGLFDDSSDSGD